MDYPFQSPEKLVAIIQGRQYIEKNGNTISLSKKISSNFRGGQEPVCILQCAKSILHYALYTMHHASCIVYVRSHCIELYMLYYTIIYYYIILLYSVAYYRLLYSILYLSIL